ncbi:hypothetical protein HanRHA438_Chr17g0803391 [Helianthus annuus]|nr:hypothetical protein HanRHA438_Chr17g0803391 [Helianthus annuus]
MKSFSLKEDAYFEFIAGALAGRTMNLQLEKHTQIVKLSLMSSLILHFSIIWMCSKCQLFMRLFSHFYKDQAKKALESALGGKKNEFEKWDKEIKKREEAGGGGGGGGDGLVDQTVSTTSDVSTNDVVYSRSLLRVRLRLGFLVSLQLTFHGSDHHMEFWSAVTIQEFWSAVSGQITY